MSVYACILRDTQVTLWGLTSRQRLERQLHRITPVRIVDNMDAVPRGASVIILRGDFLYDDRIIKYLVRTNDLLVKAQAGAEQPAVAAHVTADQAAQVYDVINDAAGAAVPAGVEVIGPQQWSTSLFENTLLKSAPRYILPITPDNQRVLEELLFTGAYKGVTDLVTKWIWPAPAQRATRFCVRHGIRPNHVTTVSVVLVVLAGLLFAYGSYGWGLVAGWLMTFLDTVDGKLARVTVASSRTGHILDHGLDIIHPPLWYIAWGVGAAAMYGPPAALSLSSLLWIIVIGYTVGRLIEGSFQLWLGRFGIYCWRRVDSYFRLVTARRNPNLILLSAGAILERPDIGLNAVAVWTLASSLFLLVRFALALHERITSGALHSWFVDIDGGAQDHSLAARMFTHQRSIPGVGPHG